MVCIRNVHQHVPETSEKRFKTQNIVKNTNLCYGRPFLTAKIELQKIISKNPEKSFFLSKFFFSWTTHQDQTFIITYFFQYFSENISPTEDRRCSLKKHAKMINFSDFFNLDHKIFLKKNDFFLKQWKSSRKWSKMLWNHTSVFLHFCDYLVAAISSFWA